MKLSMWEAAGERTSGRRWRFLRRGSFGFHHWMCFIRLRIGYSAIQFRRYIMDAEIERLVREKHEKIAEAKCLVKKQVDQCQLLLNIVEPLVVGCGLPLDILVVPREIRIEHTCQVRCDGPDGKIVYKSLRGGYPGSPMILSEEECIGQIKNDLADLIVNGLPKPSNAAITMNQSEESDFDIFHRYIIDSPIGVVLFWISVVFLVSMLGYFIEWLHR